MDDFTKRLNFESDTFSDMKRDMNFVLQRLLANMQEKGSTEGSMTLKVDISFDQEYIPNFDKSIEGESRQISKPRFKHKVTSAVQIKDEKSGNMDTEMELVYDEDNGEYVMKPVANTSQRTIFDKDFQDNLSGEEQEGEAVEKPAGTPQLPGPTDDVIDAEYTEVDSKEETDQDTQEPEVEGVIQEENPEDLEDVTDELLGGSESEGDDGFDDYNYEEPEGE